MSDPLLITESGDYLVDETGLVYLSSGDVIPTPGIWDVGIWDESLWSYVQVSGEVIDGSDAVLGGIALIDPVGGLISEAPDVAVGAITSNQGVSGNVTENQDGVTGTVSVINFVDADVTENQDDALGQIGIKIGVSGAVAETEDDAFALIEKGPTPVFGDIDEGEDQVSNDSSITIGVSGAIVENKDKARGNLFGVSGYKRPGGGWAPQFHYKREWEIKAELVVEPEVVIDLAAEPDPYFIPQALPMDPAVERIIASILQGPAMVDTDESDIEEILMHL